MSYSSAVVSVCVSPCYQAGSSWAAPDTDPGAAAAEDRVTPWSIHPRMRKHIYYLLSNIYSSLIVDISYLHVSYCIFLCIFTKDLEPC